MRQSGNALQFERQLSGRDLPLPTDLAPGTYSLVVGLYRAADGQRLTTSSGPLSRRSADTFDLREIIVQ